MYIFFSICLLFNLKIILAEEELNIQYRSKRQGFSPDAFFEKFGYLEEKTGTNQQHSPADREKAIRNFQQMVGLPQTGILDRKTIKKMQAPRCGNKDVLREKDVKRNKKSSNIQLRPEEFKTLGLKWPKNEVTWKIVGYTRTNPLSSSIQRRAFINAFNKWSAVSPLTFREVRGDADILIDFKRYDHRDGSPFDGRSGTLAHAFFPGKSGISGDTHFDDDEQWTMNTPEGTNLEIVAAHEFGHALGLSHTNVPEALMAPYYQGYDKNYKLHKDDILGIQSLYGRPSRTTRRPYYTTRRTYPTRRPYTQRPYTTRRPYTRPTTRRPTRPTPPVDICSVKFDTIFNAHDSSLYATRKDQIYKFNSNGVGIQRGFPRKTRKVYKRAPKNAGAAVKDRYRRVYMFKGNKIFRYTGYQLDRGFPKRIRGKTNFYRNLQAALSWYDGRIYVFKGDKYSIWDERYTTPPRGYPRPISSFWGGIPVNVEAAIRWNRYTYFFKGRNYFKFDDRYRRKYTGYPKRKAAPWLGCGQFTPK
ncbi:matrix metalloproteinase-24-like [Saccostrea cucullata]|uniref:matrix metalloproteinase-24-like n=1 Tax=Saccostrea cuccullata TaxID=36930 RepID=UPI002ED60DD5